MFKYKIFIWKNDRLVPVYGIGTGAEDFVSAMKILDETYDEELDHIEWLSLICHTKDVLEFKENGEQDFENFEDKFNPYYW